MEFVEKCGDMTGDQLLDRVTEAYNHVMPAINVIPYVGIKDISVTYIYPELTALCPMTGIQDLYTITVYFTPDRCVPELKSLKMYYLAYRDLPISHEHLASKIREDFEKQVQPASLDICLDVAVRGGIKTTVEL